VGDRCYLRIQIHPDDYLIAKEHLEPKTYQSWPDALGDTSSGDFWADEVSFEHGALIIEEYEANYGWYDELGEMGVAGCRFIAYNGAGGEYGHGCTFGTGVLNPSHPSGGYYYYEMATDSDGTPIARIDMNGLLYARDKPKLREMMRAYSKVCKIFTKLREQAEE